MTRTPGPNLDLPEFDDAVERFWRSMRTEGGEQRRRALDWVAQRVAQHLGGDWFEKALQHPELFIQTFTMPCDRSLLIQAVERAARLEEMGGVAGFARTRHQMRTDLKRNTFVHMDVVMEVAALALAGSDGLRFEASLGSSPIDLVLGSGYEAMPIEVLTVHFDQQFRDADQRTTYLGEAARAIGHRHGVTIDLHFHHLPPDDEEFVARLLDVLESAAVRPLKLSIAGVDVTIRSDDAFGGLTGPEVHTNYIARVANSIATKMTKDYASRPVWLRVEVRNGLWLFPAWARYGLQEKMETLRAALAPVLDPERVAGLVLTPGAGTALAPVDEESHGDLAGCWAIRRNVAGWRAREVIVLTTGPRWRRESQRWRVMYEREATWLHDAVLRHGLPPVESLY